MLIRLYALLLVCCLGGFYLPHLNAQCTIILSTQVTNTCSLSLIDLTPEGGTEPYTYQWSDGSTTQDINFTSAGNYSVTVTDALGCSQTTSEMVSTPVEISLQISVTPVSCFGGANGAVNLTVNNLPAPYFFQWNTGAATQNIAALIAGTYTVTVSDGGSCTKSVSATITQPTPLIIQATTTNISCFGAAAGAIDLTASGGTSGYTFHWSNGALTKDIGNLIAGTYTVTVTDANGCTGIKSVTITQPNEIAIVFQTSPILCNGDQTGGIDITVSGGMPPYSYHWSNSVNTQDLTGITAGGYEVTVTDANGCSKSLGIVQVQPPALNLQIATPVVNCTVLNVGLDLTVSGGTGVYTYTWSTGATTQDLNNVGLGSYTVTVTDAVGCTKTASTTIVPPPLPVVGLTVNYTNCASATITTNVVGGTPPFAYTWSYPFGNPSFPLVLNSGTYSLILTDANGCSASNSVEVNLGAQGLCGVFKGYVIRDTLENCQNDVEPGLANWIVKAVGASTYYGITDSTGFYRISAQPGTYTISTIPPSPLWQPCPLLPTVSLTQPNDTITVDDLLVQSDANCPALTVSIATAQLRRCFGSYYTVDYCNQGTATAENAYVLVQLDPYLSPQSATIPYTNLGNGLLRFEVGNLGIGQCGSFNLYVTVSCAAVLGQTHCTEAHIYPDGNCLPPNVLWSGASLQVQSICGADSLRFIIKNVGVGALTETVNYIVIEDQVMLMQAPIPLLSAGDSVEVTFPANGSTWRMEVQQPAYHPGLSQPALSVEGCTTSGAFTTGFVNQFPSDDADPWIDIDCTENIGSYDPNDKQGFPVGYGAEHYIRPGTDIEYKIRFQNTGTDTAFTVLVVDTLATWLDPSTIKPGASSHPYHLELYGTGILKFHFDHILLPDSNVNEAASHGFLQFRISPRANAPLETLIENQAQIFFDFNDPVVTNTTFHRLGQQFITTGLWQPQVSGATIVVAPNPFDQEARLEVKGLTNNGPLNLQVFDLQGNKVREMNSDGHLFLLKKGDWPTGIYLFRIMQKGKLVGNGKLMVE